MNGFRAPRIWCSPSCAGSACSRPSRWGTATVPGPARPTARGARSAPA